MADRLVAPFQLLVFVLDALAKIKKCVLVVGALVGTDCAAIRSAVGLEAAVAVVRNILARRREACGPARLDIGRQR